MPTARAFVVIRHEVISRFPVSRVISGRANVASVASVARPRPSYAPDTRNNTMVLADGDKGDIEHAAMLVEHAAR